jgi:hypothetical protein
MNDQVMTVRWNMVASRSFAEGHHYFYLAWQAFGVERESGLAVTVEDQVRIDFHVLLPLWRGDIGWTFRFVLDSRWALTPHSKALKRSEWWGFFRCFYYRHGQLYRVLSRRVDGSFHVL